MYNVAHKRLLKKIFIVSIFGLLTGCLTTQSPKFAIKPLGDKFSDPSTPYGFSGCNNKLSNKSSQGGKHIDYHGVYLDPFVYRDRKTDEIKSIGFFVSHYGWGSEDGFRPIREIIFLTDRGQRIVLKVKSQDSDFKVHGWNTISKQYNTSYNETGLGHLTKQDFYALLLTKSVEIKIAGGKRSQTYDKDEVLENFLSNLRVFYESQFQKKS